VVEYGSNHSNSSKRLERLKRLVRFEPGPLAGSPLDRHTDDLYRRNPLNAAKRMFFGG
jgi:hypothetical protein